MACSKKEKGRKGTGGKRRCRLVSARGRIVKSCVTLKKEDPRKNGT